MELASRADQRVLRWFGHVERMDDYRMPQKGVDGRCQWGTRTMETEVRLDGWCEGGLRQQRNDGGGCATMRERPENVESPGIYVTERLSRGHCWPCVLSDRPPLLWWLSHGEGRDTVT